ncbi:hypothetical protein BJX63DRAFT_136908 [Aspergillus granulosus]|uniref:Uncharacterized protein n=1 Tax=Aspergillus granulosus TaxID=176169 RepID=A0ABR4HLU3_9EURO
MLFSAPAQGWPAPKRQSAITEPPFHRSNHPQLLPELTTRVRCGRAVSDRAWLACGLNVASFVHNTPPGTTSDVPSLPPDPTHIYNASLPHTLDLPDYVLVNKSINFQQHSKSNISSDSEASGAWLAGSAARRRRSGVGPRAYRLHGLGSLRDRQMEGASRTRIAGRPAPSRLRRC